MFIRGSTGLDFCPKTKFCSSADCAYAACARGWLSLSTFCLSSAWPKNVTISSSLHSFNVPESWCCIFQLHKDSKHISHWWGHEVLKIVIENTQIMFIIYIYITVYIFIIIFYYFFNTLTYQKGNTNWDWSAKNFLQAKALRPVPPSIWQLWTLPRGHFGGLLMCSLPWRTGVVFVQLTFNDHTHNMLFAVWHFKFKFSPSVRCIFKSAAAAVADSADTTQKAEKTRWQPRPADQTSPGYAPMPPHAPDWLWPASALWKNNTLQPPLPFRYE